MSPKRTCCSSGDTVSFNAAFDCFFPLFPHRTTASNSSTSFMFKASERTSSTKASCDSLHTSLPASAFFACCSTYSLHATTSWSSPFSVAEFRKVTAVFSVRLDATYSAVAC